MTERQNFLLSLYREFGSNAQNALDFVKKNDSDDSPAAAAPVVTTIENWNPFSAEIMHKEFAELVPRFMFVNNFLMREEDVNALKSDDEKDRLDALADGIYTYLRNVIKGIGDINSVVLQKTEFEAVDLGLPSGTKWSNMNLGADKPAETGFYLTHYDACDYKFGNNWQMPTEDDFVELCDNCDSEWILFDGVHGRMFTSKINGAKVFFPAAGGFDGTTLGSRGAYGYYWASTLKSSAYGRLLYFSSSGVLPQSSDSRFLGFSVRAVQKFA